MYGVTREIVEVYASLFVGCWQYYAVQQRDGSYRPSRSPLNYSLLASHLQGRFTLGTYVVDRAGYCSFAVFDADSEDGLERLVMLSQVLAEQGIFLILEASRDGRGHGWVHLDQPTRAAVVRAWLLPYAQTFGMELYPKQDEVRVDGFGSLIRLPLGVHRRSGGWYPFVVGSARGELVQVGETVADCCVWAGSVVQRVSVPLWVRELVEEREDEESSGGLVVPGSGQQGYGMIRAWCRQQDIVEVVGRYTHLDRSGVGRCPLPGHHYRGDVRPSLQVFGGDDPHWYCYTRGRAGDVFDFLRFYHGLSLQEAYIRLKRGALF